MKKLIIVIAALIILAFGVFMSSKFSQPEMIACTQEAKLCSDGSAVGRTGPNCEFAKCPSEE